MRFALTLLPRPVCVGAAASALVVAVWSCTGGVATEPTSGAALDALAQSPPTVSVGCDGCIALVDGQVFDGKRTRPGVVVLNGTRIETVEYGAVRVVAGESRSVSGQTLLPGLFDLHVHIQADAGPYGYFATRDQTQNHLKSMLRSGITSFLDLGSSQHMAFEMRKRIQAGDWLSPSMYAAGPLLNAHRRSPMQAWRRRK